MSKLFVSTHDDDQILFGAFTLIKEKPLVLVVTDSYIQSNRGENITAKQRELESKAAVEMLGCPMIRGRIRDDVIYEGAVRDLLSRFIGFDEVYIPAVQGGNPQHDIVGKVGLELFPNAVKYSNYAKGEWFTKGNIEVKGDQSMQDLKQKALECFKSQISLPATKGHFEAVKNHSEWFI